MGKDQIQDLRRRLRAGGGRGRKGYAAQLREEVVALAHEWQRQGGSRRDLATKLGLGVRTLSKWTRASTAGSVRIRAVELSDAVDEKPRAGLIAILPCGVRLAGLSVADAAELARRLR